MKFVIFLMFALFCQVLSLETGRTTLAPCPGRLLTRYECARIRFRFMCNDNSDCEEGQKCCNNGCVGTCVPASQNVEPQITSTTSGTCPAPTLTSDQCLVVTFASCSRDAECGVNRKCCNNGCGKTCTATVKQSTSCAKPGTCPKENVNCIWSQCKSDCDCPGNNKCCYGCLCTKPVLITG